MSRQRIPALTLAAALLWCAILPTTATADEPSKFPPVSLGEKAVLTDEIAVTPIEIVEDSRCPVEVQCIQAGSLIVRVKIDRNGEISERTMEFGSVVLVPGGVVRFYQAPAPSVEPIEAYLLGFSYVDSEDF